MIFFVPILFYNIHIDDKINSLPQKCQNNTQLCSQYSYKDKQSVLTLQIQTISPIEINFTLHFYFQFLQKASAL